MWTKIGGHPNREGVRPNTITQHNYCRAGEPAESRV